MPPKKATKTSRLDVKTPEGSFIYITLGNKEIAVISIPCGTALYGVALYSAALCDTVFYETVPYDAVPLRHRPSRCRQRRHHLIRHRRQIHTASKDSLRYHSLL